MTKTELIFGIIVIVLCVAAVSYYAGRRIAILDVITGEYDIEAEKEKYHDSKK